MLMNTALLAMAKNDSSFLARPTKYSASGTIAPEGGDHKQPAQVGHGDEQPHAAAKKDVRFTSSRPIR